MEKIKAENMIPRVFFANIIFLAFIASLPLLNESGFLTFECGFTVYPAYILAIAAFFAALHARMKNNAYHFIHSGVGLPLMTFLYAIALSIIQTRFIISAGRFTPVSHAASLFTKLVYLRSISQVAAIIFMAGIFYLVIAYASDANSFKKTLFVFLGSTMLVCIVALTALSLLHVYGYDVLRRLTGVPFVLDEVASGLRGIRLSGFTPEPLIFGTYLSAVLPIAAGAWCSRLFNRAFSAAAIVLILTTLIFTFSRGALIASFCSAVIFISFSLRDLRRIFMLHKKIVVSCLLITLISAGFWRQKIVLFAGHITSSTTMQKIKDQTIDQIRMIIDADARPDTSGPEYPSSVSTVEWGTLMRLNDIKAGINMFKDHPILGVGWGNYLYQYLHYDPKLIGWWWVDFPETDNRPGTPVCCNLFASVAGESGLLGLGAFIWFILSLAAAALSAIRNLKEQKLRYVAIGLLSSAIALFVSYQFFSTIYYPFIWVVLALIICMRKISLKNA